LGAAGFRVDMAGSLIKSSREKNQAGDIESVNKKAALNEMQKFWQDIRAMLDLEHPEAVLISEWMKPDQSIPAGFHSDFSRGGKLGVLRQSLDLGKTHTLGEFGVSQPFTGTPDDILNGFIEQTNEAQTDGCEVRNSEKQLEITMTPHSYIIIKKKGE